MVSSLFPEGSLQFGHDLPNAWGWNLEEILSKSKIVGIPYYDPITAGSLLMGKHLETEAQTGQERDSLPQFLDLLRQKDEGSFFDLSRQLIRQTHYITSRFEKHSSQALTSFKEAAPEILDFIADEKGHDRLMLHSLKALGCENPNKIDVCPESTALMKLLEVSARHFPLSFACLISFFEGASYGVSDPIADVLAKSSRPDASMGYKIHFNINKDGHHNNVAFDLLKKLPMQPMKSVEIAARSLELAARLGNMFDVSFVQKVKRRLI